MKEPLALQHLIQVLNQLFTSVFCGSFVWALYRMQYNLNIKLLQGRSILKTFSTWDLSCFSAMSSSSIVAGVNGSSRALEHRQLNHEKGNTFNTREATRTAVEPSMPVSLRTVSGSNLTFARSPSSAFVIPVKMSWKNEAADQLTYNKDRGPFGYLIEWEF